MQQFIISRNMRYVIYGAGGNCYHIKRLFENAGFGIEAILDKRAEEIQEIEGTPVHTLEQFASMGGVKGSCVIIISIKNVFGHIDIARKLLEQGYHNIIYKPLPVLHGAHDEEWDSINDAYEMIVEKGDLANLVERGIFCSRRGHMVEFKDELMVEEDGSHVLCWIPLELVCNYDRDDAFGLLPMGAYYPLTDLYRYLFGYEMADEWKEIQENYFLYSADWVERSGNQFSGSLKKSMVSARVDVFGAMQKKADIDKEFFSRNAVSVKCKDKIRFYLSSSGRNRVSFLAARGSRFIPVHMSREDYAHWLNQRAFGALREYLDEQCINQLFTVVPHPMMVSYATETVDYASLFCMPVIKEIFKALHRKSAYLRDGAYPYYQVDRKQYRQERDNLKVCAAIKDEGNMGRLLLLHGLGCIRVYEDERAAQLGGKLDELFYINDRNFVLSKDSATAVRQCQILIADSRMVAPLLEEFEGDTVFVLQWGDDKGLRNYQEIFRNNKLLFRTVWHMEQVSGWMLAK